MKRLLLAAIATIALSTPAMAGDPMIGMTIVLSVDGTPIASAATDSDGFVRFDLQHEGLYELSAPNWRGFSEAADTRFQMVVRTEDGMMVSSACPCREDRFVTFRSFRAEQEVTVRIEYPSDAPAPRGR